MHTNFCRNACGTPPIGSLGYRAGMVDSSDTPPPPDDANPDGEAGRSAWAAATPAIGIVFFLVGIVFWLTMDFLAAGIPFVVLGIVFMGTGFAGRSKQPPADHDEG